MTSGLNLVDIYFFLTDNILQFQTSDFITSIGCKFSTELNEQVFINILFNIALEAYDKTPYFVCKNDLFR